MPEPKFQRGDRVRFQLSGRPIDGSVKEDRGAIGIRGRHLYLVEFQIDSQSASTIELPTESLEAAHGTASAR